MSFKFPEEYRIIMRPLEPFGDQGNNGAAVFKYKGRQIFCICSDNDGWEHVAVTMAYPPKKTRQTPTWEVMNFVKDLFWDDEDFVFQFHPPKSKYVNFHPHCLHLWRPVDDNFPYPPKKLVNGDL
jgi:hypothetical protein